MQDVDYARKRARLVALLCQAAELEHALCCQYLYVGFSLKQDPDHEYDGPSPEQFEYLRRWKRSLLMIARQEMVHLATVCNMLSALGEAPHFVRPDFPISGTQFPAGIAIDLVPFCISFLDNAILLEAPRDPADKHEISDLYAEVEDLVKELGEKNPNALLIGPVTAQVDNSSCLPSYPDTERSNRRPMWNMQLKKIRSLEQALTAIQQVRQEAEGASRSVPPVEGHYQILLGMKAEYQDMLAKDPKFEPSRPVVTNPWCNQDRELSPSALGRTILEHPCSEEAAGTFNLGYEIMLRMLIMFFTQNPLTRPGFESLRDVTFLPFMSLIIRPLGEFLTWMPAFPQGRATAGAPFRCPRQVHQLPHADAAWRVLGAQLGELRDRTQALSMLPDMPVWLAPRLQMLAENAWRMHHNFYEYLRVG